MSSTRKVQDAARSGPGRNDLAKLLPRRFRTLNTKAAATMAKRRRIAVSLQANIHATHAPASAACLTDFVLQASHPYRITPNVAAQNSDSCMKYRS